MSSTSKRGAKRAREDTPLRDTEAQATDAQAVLGAVRTLKAKQIAETSSRIIPISSSSSSSALVQSSSSSRALSASAAGLTGVREVKEQTADEVLDEIERSLLVVARSVLSGEGFEYEVPSRGGANSKYEEALGRIVLQARTSTRSFSVACAYR